MKIAILNDTHCGVRNGSDIFLDNANKFYSETFFPYLEEHGIKQIIHLGDYYDNRKAINIKAAHSNRKNFLHELRRRGIHMDIFVGNHDTFYKNTNEINSLKEMLGHYTKEISIHMEPVVKKYDTMGIGLIPWMCPDNQDKVLHFLDSTDVKLLAGHFELSGFDMMRGVESKHGMSPSVLKDFSAVLSGHYHTKSTKGNIHYLGSQLEFTWADAGDPKYFHVLDTDTGSLKPIRNYHNLFEKIIYNDEEEHDYAGMSLDHLAGRFVRVVVVKKLDVDAYDEFIARIEAIDTLELKIAENFSEYVGKNVTIDMENVDVENTAVVLSKYVDGTDTDLDKDIMKTQLLNLLSEAQALEV